MQVTLTNIATGVARKVATDATGFYIHFASKQQTQ